MELAIPFAILLAWNIMRAVSLSLSLSFDSISIFLRTIYARIYALFASNMGCTFDIIKVTSGKAIHPLPIGIPTAKS